MLSSIWHDLFGLKTKVLFTWDQSIELKLDSRLICKTQDDQSWLQLLIHHRLLTRAKLWDQKITKLWDKKGGTVLVLKFNSQPIWKDARISSQWQGLVGVLYVWHEHKLEVAIRQQLTSPPPPMHNVHCSWHTLWSQHGTFFWFVGAQDFF